MNIPPSTADATQTRSQAVSFMSGEHQLTGHLFLPTSKPVAIAILNGATGVPARFYHPFATWLAAKKGIACLTYDYRDFGASSNGPLKHSSATMMDWGVSDQEAARDFAKASDPDTPLWVIGHSLGTQCLPFQRDLDDIDRVVVVGSGLVHVRDHPWPYQAFARLFWFGPFPVVAYVMGYLPGKAMRLGADLPKGVYWQWRRWCTYKDYYSRDFGIKLPFPELEGVRAPVKFVAIQDDVMIPPKCVWRMMQCFPNAPKTQLVLCPEDYGLKHIGHINAFSPRCSAAWNEIVA